MIEGEREGGGEREKGGEREGGGERNGVGEGGPLAHRPVTGGLLVVRQTHAFISLQRGQTTTPPQLSYPQEAEHSTNPHFPIGVGSAWGPHGTMCPEMSTHWF